MAIPSTSDRLIHLDMLRGVAALVVVIGHVRGFLFVDHSTLASPGPLSYLFYAATSLGHQAVIAFFALSGFLVGGKALQNLISNNWSWRYYLIARLSRLWTVVIPALLLTLAFDMAGSTLGGDAGYAGRYYALLSSGPTLAQPADHSLWTFAANIAFLQTIAAPVFGTNGPFWSLANEFWYYIIFPLIGAAIWARHSVWLRISYSVAAIGLMLVLPPGLVALGAIWLAGAGAHYLTRQPGVTKLFAHPLYLLTALAFLAVSIASQRLAGSAAPGLISDLVLGGAWAIVLPALATMAPLGGLYARTATGLSDISYTLYATHYPLLALIWFSAIAPAQYTLNMASIALALGMTLVALGAAKLIWWCFERHTNRIRIAVLQAFGEDLPKPDAAKPTSKAPC